MLTATRYQKSKRKLSDYPYKVLKFSSNKKLKSGVKAGAFKGYKIMTLTLEERATCPTSCHHWNDCFGNNMPFAHRLEHGQELINRIDQELEEHKGKLLLIRLHILGDFWSPDYVKAWANWLAKYPNIAIWGYTHNHPDSPVKLERDIARAIDNTRQAFGKRFSIRWSDRPDLAYSANSEALQAPEKGKAIICPEQQGHDGCGTCTLCWDQPERQVIFLTH